jgi:Xaa-Pro aminopeptidase
MQQPFKIPADEIARRIKGIQKEMQAKDIAAALIVQRVDLFYFSGTAQNGNLYIPAEGEPLLLIRKYMPRALGESSVRRIIEIKSVKDLPLRISDVYGKLPGSIGFEFDVMPVREFNFYRQLFPDTDCVDASPLIHKVRMIKSDWEIRQMEKTAELSAETFEYIRNHIRPGYTEMELSGMFEAFARKRGHGAQLRVRDYQTEGYPWHVLSGKSGGMVGVLDSPASGEGTSAAFPCGAGAKKIESNEPVMIDVGWVFNGYHADETRMFAIGKMPEKAMRASEAVIEIHNAVLDKAKPGVSLDELVQFAVGKAETLGYAEQFLGPPGYKVTFIGHGIGVELIETPIIAAGKKDRLEAGMTFALEPKMVFENEFSAGVESVFQVTETGARLISRVPVEIFIC